MPGTGGGEIYDRMTEINIGVKIFFKGRQHYEDDRNEKVVAMFWVTYSIVGSRRGSFPFTDTAHQ
jgi:hypothetical protein